MAGFAFPSPTNTYIPNADATGNLLVGYSRQTDNWAVNRYAQIIPVEKMVGVYWLWNSEQSSRISSDGSLSLWKDGDEAPTGNDNLESFSSDGYQTHRRAYPFSLGNLTLEQSTLPLLKAQSSVVAGQCMTERTNLAIQALETANWGSHTAPVDGAAGGTALFPSGDNFATGTATTPWIKMALNQVTAQINTDTNGVVIANNLHIVINPKTALRMSTSAEIHAYVKESQFAQAELRGDSPNLNGTWSMPSKLYGFDLEVDQTTMITQLKGQTTVRQYVVPDNTMYVISRVGELVGVEGAQSFSTLMGFFYKDEMSVYTKVDTDNERTIGRVVSNYCYKVPSTVSGFRFTRIFG